MSVFFGKGDFARPTIASAATCDLSTINDHFVEITGTVTITSLGSTAGLWKDCYATAGFILTNNAAIITGTGANITVAAGDSFSVLANASGVFSVISYRRASGKALVGPASTDISDSTSFGRALLTAANVAAQRTALALGGAAVLNVGTTAGTVAAGDDSRIGAGAPLASPAFTGTPTCPTAAVDTNTTQLADTAFVIAQAASATPIVDGTAAVGTSTRFARGDHVHPTDTSRAALASPTFTGTPAAPTAAVDTSTTQLATTAYVVGQASASGDGTPAIDGSAARGTSTHFARADHVHPTDTTRAPLASPTFTGTPAAPTAAVDTNTTQLATTAMVLAQAASATPLMDSVAAVGTSTRFARADHVHATDTSLQRHPGYVAARWYWAFDELDAAGSTHGANTIRLLPFMLPVTVTMSDLAAKVSTADAAGNFQLAVYNSDATTHLPTTVAASTGNISTASAVVVSADITGANVTLAPGLYWAASCTSSSTAAFLSVHPSETLSNCLIGTATLANLVSSTTPLLTRSFSQTFGTWPDLTGQTLTESNSSIIAMLAFKAA